MLSLAIKAEFSTALAYSTTSSARLIISPFELLRAQSRLRTNPSRILVDRIGFKGCELLPPLKRTPPPRLTQTNRHPRTLLLGCDLFSPKSARSMRCYGS
ncbi:hypothetical protein Cob_v005967 [Colletotrichum orbiculare MAFF 240422]|uniref:Uncharacterized protein n=1 Tax=Colletotrichum orbiculare (strain 104-T / ATCC 96160 / CBS 514.97 / LARS 414 / MAFF 240422) TaxID=1213857 RepID=A0A484FVK8_COLOR|nr:hypothetical protein Cob_v005967 [Colletotrichum orbiculare MAFF 240422]